MESQQELWLLYIPTIRMKSIRIHGRGGQGAVLASRILSYAYFLEGKFSQSFPTYGAERRGAPVAAFVKVNDKFIQERCPIRKADIAIILSDTILQFIDIEDSMNDGSIILLNSKKNAVDLNIKTNAKVVIADLAKIAVSNKLGSSSSPIVNIPAVGMIGKIDHISFDNLKKATEKFVPSHKERNLAALEEAYGKNNE